MKLPRKNIFGPLLWAEAMLLCLSTLQITSFAWGLTDVNPISSSGSVVYPQNITLFFRSGWESPVEFADLTKTHFTGADQGFDWSDYSHLINYVGGELSLDMDTRLDNFSHSGSRSLKQTVLRSGPVHRNELNFYTEDSVFGNKIFVRRWLYYPANMTFPSKGWMVISSHRELRGELGDFVVGLIIGSSYHGEEYWNAGANRYAGTDGDAVDFWNEYNYSVLIPKGRWFRLETYIERHPTNGVYRVWVDGEIVFDLEGVKTKNDSDKLVSTRVGKVYVGDEDYGYTYPYYHWMDDLEIWDGIPQ